MIRIDGSVGEGGGQILRTALSLSLATGTPFQIENIRAGRKNAGLLRQHLTAVLAAAEVGSAKVDGATLGSSSLTFTPGVVRAGEYRFAVGTAGSGTLVFQTILPALLLAMRRRVWSSKAERTIWLRLRLIFSIAHFFHSFEGWAQMCRSSSNAMGFILRAAVASSRRSNRAGV
jgi:hypothetical protein